MQYCFLYLQPSYQLTKFSLSDDEYDVFGDKVKPPAPIVAGCIIEYYNPIGIAGIPNNLRRATVTDVRELMEDRESLESNYPLSLHPVCPLEEMTQVCVIAVPNSNGELEPVAGPTFHEICKHKLIVGTLPPSSNRSVAGGAGKYTLDD